MSDRSRLIVVIDKRVVCTEERKPEGILLSSRGHQASLGDKPATGISLTFG